MTVDSSVHSFFICLVQWIVRVFLKGLFEGLMGLFDKSEGQVGLKKSFVSFRKFRIESDGLFAILHRLFPLALFKVAGSTVAVQSLVLLQIYSFCVIFDSLGELTLFKAVVSLLL